MLEGPKSLDETAQVVALRLRTKKPEFKQEKKSNFFQSFFHGLLKESPLVGGVQLGVGVGTATFLVYSAYPIVLAVFNAVPPCFIVGASTFTLWSSGKYLYDRCNKNTSKPDARPPLVATLNPRI